MKWRAMERTTALTRYMLVQRGRTKRDSFSDSELQALNISMTDGEGKTSQH